MNLIGIYRDIRRFFKQYKLCIHNNIKLYNYQILNPLNYTTDIIYDIKTHWFYQFVKHRLNFENSGKTLSIFGVNGNKLAIYIDKSEIKLFYTFENVHNKISPWYIYNNLLLENKEIDLSLGFDFQTHEKYLRFPYWLTTLFNPTDGIDAIKNTCKQISEPYVDDEKRQKFCSFICRLDYFGDREYLANQLNQIEQVSFPGEFLHNDNELKEKFNDNKVEYLKQFKFNLCPENTNYEGYVTEKIFGAIMAGCIPIYWGSDNNPEPEILNQERIIFINTDKDNSKALEKIRLLNCDEKAYRDFINQKILKENAAEIIYNYFYQLEQKLQQIIINK